MGRFWPSSCYQILERDFNKALSYPNRSLGAGLCLGHWQVRRIFHLSNRRWTIPKSQAHGGQLLGSSLEKMAVVA